MEKEPFDNIDGRETVANEARLEEKEGPKTEKEHLKKNWALIRKR